MQPLDVVLEERRRRSGGVVKGGGGVAGFVAGDVQLAHLEVALAGVALKRADISIRYISRQADGFDDALLRAACKSTGISVGLEMPSFGCN